MESPLFDLDSSSLVSLSCLADNSPGLCPPFEMEVFLKWDLLHGLGGFLSVCGVCHSLRVMPVLEGSVHREYPAVLKKGYSQEELTVQLLSAVEVYISRPCVGDLALHLAYKKPAR